MCKRNHHFPLSKILKRRRKGDKKMATSKSSFKLILGSSSAARRQILAEMGYQFSIVTADIDEKSIRKDKPEELVVALAESKANAIIERLQTTGQLKEDNEATLLITADTVVVYKGLVREKPISKEEAWNFIKDYSGSHAAVVSSALVTNLTTGKRKGAWERAEDLVKRVLSITKCEAFLQVYFYEIPDEIIDRVIEEGSTLNIAGGFSMENPLTSPFIEAVVGNMDTVVGLPKDLTQELIAQVL